MKKVAVKPSSNPIWVEDWIVHTQSSKDGFYAFTLASPYICVRAESAEESIALLEKAKEFYERALEAEG